MAEYVLLRIASLDDYVKRRGITHQPHNKVNYFFEQEAARIREANEYQKSIHVLIFGDVDDHHNYENKKEQAQHLFSILNYSNMSITVRTSDGMIENVLLQRLVALCDVVYARALSKYWSFTTSSSIQDIVSLVDYTTKEVSQFLSLVQTDHPSISVNLLPFEHIVACTRMAHFLQSQHLLSYLIERLDACIDTHNCASICVLADHLQIPSLFQSSLSTMMDTIQYDDMDRNNNNMQEHDLWKQLPPYLQYQIVNVRKAMHASIVHLDRNLLSSPNEFLAILAENVRDQSERLIDAKQRQEDIIMERNCCDNMRRRISGGGRTTMSRGRTRHRDAMDGCVRDAALHMERQDLRLRALEVFYREQVIIFRGDEKGEGGGSTVYCR